MVGNLLRRARVPRKDRAASSGPGSSRTGTPACPPVRGRFQTGQTGVSCPTRQTNRLRICQRARCYVSPIAREPVPAVAPASSGFAYLPASGTSSAQLSSSVNTAESIASSRCVRGWKNNRISAPSVGTGYSVHCEVFTSYFIISSPPMMLVQTSWWRIDGRLIRLQRIGSGSGTIVTSACGYQSWQDSRPTNRRPKRSRRSCPRPSGAAPRTTERQC